MGLDLSTPVASQKPDIPSTPQTATPVSAFGFLSSSVSNSKDNSKVEHLNVSVEQAPPPKSDLFSFLNQKLSNTSTNIDSDSKKVIENSAISSIDGDVEKTTNTFVETPGPLHPEQHDDFEELSEGREIIEERIFRVELQMINLTIGQKDISCAVSTLVTDIEDL